MTVDLHKNPRDVDPAVPASTTPRRAPVRERLRSDLALMFAMGLGLAVAAGVYEARATAVAERACSLCGVGTQFSR